MDSHYPSGLDDVCRRLDVIERQFDDLPDRLERAFIRREVMEAREVATALQLRGLEAETHSMAKRLDAYHNERDAERHAAEERRLADRRMVRSALLAAVLSLGVGMGLTVLTVFLSIGG